MILQITTLTDGISVLDFSLWVLNVYIIFTIVSFILYRYLKNRKEWEKSQKQNIITWLILLICIGVANTLNIVWRFLISDVQIADFIDYSSFLILYIGFFIKILYLERGINRSEFYKGYYFSIGWLIVIGFAIVANPLTLKQFGIIQILFFVFIFFSFGELFVLFLYLAIKATGEARKNALKMFIGAFLLGTGLVFVPQNVGEYFIGTDFYDIWMVLVRVTSPFLISLGVILIYISFNKNL